jgi:hypothetical protein
MQYHWMNIYLGSPGKFESLILHAQGIFSEFYKFLDQHKKLNTLKKVTGLDPARPVQIRARLVHWCSGQPDSDQRGMGDSQLSD